MLGLRKITRFFFVFIVPLKPNRFGWGFFGFRFLEPEPNRTETFCKKINRFNRFFFRFGFFGYFFLGFLGLFGFSVFLLTPTENSTLLSSEPTCRSKLVVLSMAFSSQ
jgi:hypothetical protein